MAKNVATQETGGDVVVMPTIGEYAVAQGGPEAIKNLIETIQTNIGGSGIDEFKLDRLKVPAGGGTAFAVPTLEGTKNMDEIEGVIVHSKNIRAYWTVPFDQSGGGSPPDCSSIDSFTGLGDPGGNCQQCPLAAFGSAPDRDGNESKGQACKQMKLLFTVRPDQLLPNVIVCPPTSLGTVEKYMMRLTSHGVPFYAVTTKFHLEKDKNVNGIEYSKVTPEMGKRLEPEELAIIKAYSDGIRGALTTFTLPQEDFEEVARS